jgi:hypothetical protein
MTRTAFNHAVLLLEGAGEGAEDDLLVLQGALRCHRCS